MMNEMMNKDQLSNFAWRRWYGRGLDELVGFLLIAGAIFALDALSGLEEVAEDAELTGGQMAATLVSLFLMLFALPLSVFFGSIQYALFKTTLGKAICGEKVCDEEGRLISRWGFFWRDCKVLVVGEGLRLYVLAAVMNLIQYHRVANGKPASYEAWNRYKATPTRDRRWYDPLMIVSVVLLSLVALAFVVGIYGA